MVRIGSQDSLQNTGKNNRFNRFKFVSNSKEVSETIKKNTEIEKPKTNKTNHTRNSKEVLKNEKRKEHPHHQVDT